MWTAMYIPVRVNGEPDPSKDDFACEADAWAHVYSMMCGACQEERDRVLAGKGEEFDSIYPPCTMEWEVFSAD